MVVWNKGVAVCLVELALELHPVQAERVQETLEHVHAHENCQGDDEPYREQNEYSHDIERERYRHCIEDRLLEEHKRQLLVRKRKRPES